MITLFAMIVAAIPPGDAPNRLVFGAKVIGGAAGFVVLGGLIYWRARTRARSAPTMIPARRRRRPPNDKRAHGCGAFHPTHRRNANSAAATSRAGSSIQSARR